VSFATKILFPPICLHCYEEASVKHPQLCSSCLKYLVPIDPQERCPICFWPNCSGCEGVKYHFDEVASAFENYGPPLSLLRHVQSHKKSYMARLLASFILVQWEKLRWPIPDYIVPVPNNPILTSFSIKEITHYVGYMLHLPIRRLIRKNLIQENEPYKVTKRPSITDKTLLLIQDKMSHPRDLEYLSKPLLAQTPKAIYLLAFVDNL